LRKINIIATEKTSEKLLEIAKDCYSRKFSKYLNVDILSEVISLEDIHYRINFKGFRQYFADLILEKGMKFKDENSIVIIITSSDIYTYGTNYIFGLATKGIGIISSARIDPNFWNDIPEIYEYSKKGEEFFIRQFSKVLLHEFGHTLSLSHCNKINCVMYYSNSPIELYHKGEDYCKDCWNRIILNI